MLRAELIKVRYLMLPRWTAVLVLASAIATGAALIVFRPKTASSYISIPFLVIDQVATIGAIVFGVWLAALEFSAGTLQRTLTAEPSRSRVLTAKLLTALLCTVLVSAAAAAAVGGLVHLGIIRADAPVAAGDLARAVFAAVPDALFAVTIGFGFGLLSRSMGGGITFALVFYYVLAGVLAFIPGLKKVSYGQASADFTGRLANQDAAVHSIGIALLIMLIWTAVIVVPGWLLFLRADLK